VYLRVHCGTQSISLVSFEDSLGDPNDSPDRMPISCSHYASSFNNTVAALINVPNQNVLLSVTDMRYTNLTLHLQTHRRYQEHACTGRHQNCYLDQRKWHRSPCRALLFASLTCKGIQTCHQPHEILPIHIHSLNALNMVTITSGLQQGDHMHSTPISTLLYRGLAILNILLTYSALNQTDLGDIRILQTSREHDFSHKVLDTA
jgi:hypothetical protein